MASHRKTNPKQKTPPAFTPREEARKFRTTSVDALKAFYESQDLPGWSPEKDLGRPGRFPFPRGVHETMSRGRLWTMRQYAGYATAEDSNRRYRYLLSQGQTGLSV